MKKSVSVLLAILMVLTALPLGGLSVFAETSGDFKYSVSSTADKTCSITGYTGSATRLTIPCIRLWRIYSGRLGRYSSRSQARRLELVK